MLIIINIILISLQHNFGKQTADGSYLQNISELSKKSLQILTNLDQEQEE